MPYLVVVVELPNETIQNLNDNCYFPTKSDESLQGVENILAALHAGAKSGSVEITARDTDPAVTTSGSGSTQGTYSFL